MRFSIMFLVPCLAAATLSAQTANPVVSSAQELVTRQAGFMIAAAEEMPADKYSFKPTPEQFSFGKIIAHVAMANDHVCGMLTSAAAPQTAQVTETSPKDALITALKASFDYCDTALGSLQDSQLGDTITFFGGAKKPRARALIELSADLADHYSQMAMYLRLNGMLPPSAKPRK